MNKKSTIRTSASNEASGRPTFDERGNAIWEWQVKTGKFTREVCGEQVDKLTEAANLSLLSTGMYVRNGGRASGPSFNPYDHDRVNRSSTTLNPARMHALDAKIKARKLG